MIVEDNGKEFKTKVNEGSWFDSSGDSFISTSEGDIAKEMEFTEVQANDKLTLKLGYTKDISEMKAYDVKEAGTYSRQEIEIVDNCIQAPKENGEYIYSVKVFWGEETSESSHYVSYVIKLKVV